MLLGVKQLRLYLLTHFVVFSIIFGISFQYASHSREFLVASPSLFSTNDTKHSSITFFMATVAANGTRINITTPKFKPVNVTLNKTLDLKTREMLAFSPPEHFSYIYYLDMIKIWCFRLTGRHPFSLAVLLRQSAHSFATFLAVPVYVWGKKYLAFTLGHSPSIQVISNSDNNTVTAFLSSTSGMMNVNLANYSETYTGSWVLATALHRFEAFSFSNCHLESGMSIATLIGSYLVGQNPFGVISGSCESKTFTVRCTTSSLRRVPGETSDVAMEMLLPVDAYGKEFVIVHISRRIPSTVVIMACKENTTVNITEPQGVRPVMLSTTSHWSYSFEVTQNQKLISNRKIQVVIMTLSTCKGTNVGNDMGDPAICLLLPNNFFYYEFFWSPPKEIGNHYATLVMEIDHIKYLHVNDAPLRHYDLENVLGNTKYEVSTFKLAARSNHITTPSPNRYMFACYVYGMGPWVQYMHPAGFEGCVDTVDSMFPGDLLDNDCDGKIGEEIRNGIDDDGDGRIDEDILHSRDEDGMWGEWLPWTCYPNCSRPLLFRMRHCDSPPPSGRGIDCDGEPLIIHNITCTPDIDCPRRCANFTWGHRCERSCINCGLDCNTETGRCDYCKNGFKHRESGCNTPCEENEYGRDCALVCTEKCGADCKNRVTGECPNDNRFLMMFILLLVMVVGLLLLMVRRRSREMEQVMVHYEGSLERPPVVIRHVRGNKKPRKKGRTGAIIIAHEPP